MDRRKALCTVSIGALAIWNALATLALSGEWFPKKKHSKFLQKFEMFQGKVQVAVAMERSLFASLDPVWLTVQITNHSHETLVFDEDTLRVINTIHQGEVSVPPTRLGRIYGPFGVGPHRGFRQRIEPQSCLSREIAINAYFDFTLSGEYTIRVGETINSPSQNTQDHWRGEFVIQIDPTETSRVGLAEFRRFASRPFSLTVSKSDAAPERGANRFTKFK